MRDYSNFDKNLQSLISDIYEQPEDEGHTALAQKFVRWMMVPNCDSVLDVGCGTGFCQLPLEIKKLKYTGICLGRDYQIAKGAGKNVLDMDFNFMDFPDDSFDLIFSRHSLEHSPFPLLTLMEWHRVGSKMLALVMPNPDNYTFVGRNHYSVSNPHQIVWWLRRAGWKLTQARFFKAEYWFVCEKKPVVSYEGWAQVPLNPIIHEFERDMLKNVDIDSCYKGL